MKHTNRNLFELDEVIFISEERVENIAIYNFEVEDDHSYQANGIVVHNCISETTTALNNGYLATKDIGTFVIGQGYDDACSYCKDLVIGKVYKIGEKPETNFEDLDPTSKEYKQLVKYYENYVWVGKDNVGRTGSKNKRNEDGSTTVRLRHELYFPTAPVHVSCRCLWVSFHPDLLYANDKGNFIPKSKDPEKWKEWHQKNIKDRYV